ncbi:La protein like protein [Melipona quadrifasciata]|uniref:La protein like protein n=1 Tax=Melipona quadrifasciata TaxID=166423 RepID=A0A0M8ZVM0_9HYME|nr:La protein like protein [Melipona quadrifasciata]
MENGQEKSNVETMTNGPTNDEVKNEMPVSTKESAAKQTSEEPSSELLEKIKKQVERDKFLIEQTKLDKGWIPMTIMLKFKMLASMSQDVNIILKALESSELIEISEDKKKIRRSVKHPLPLYDEEYRKAQEARTVYAKGFPLHDTTIEKLTTFLNDYESFESIIMRKYLDKEKKYQFKGSIFIQFKTIEDAKAFMDRKSVKYGDTELIRKWSADYSVEKAKEKEDRKQRRSEMKAKKHEAKERCNNDEEDSDKITPLPKGCVIHFFNVPDECSRENIKERLGQLGANVAFVDFKIGDKEGWVRMQEENAAKTVMDKMIENKITISGKDVTCRVLESDEEEKYLTKVKKQMANTRQKYTKGKKGKKGRIAREQRKRRGSDSEAVPAKKGTIE